MNIWNLIVESNTFNFIIFLLIFAIIIKYAKVSDLISALRDNVVKLINDSEDAKKQSVKELDIAKNKANMVGAEIKVISDEADLTALRLDRKIMSDAVQQAESIKNNADKIVEFEGKNLLLELSCNTAIASVELAKRHIIRTLQKKPEYHEKFIDDSINELDRFNFNE
ncbi:hypothetical protein IJG72_04580 [bacterium]|nr:hypothetical protein [bacterium]